MLVDVQAFDTFGQSGGEAAGYRKSGGVGSIGYRNEATGAIKSRRGSIFSSRCLANGSYGLIGYMEMKMCSRNNTLLNQITGKRSVAGGNIFLTPSSDFWKSTNSAAAGGNKQQPKTPAKKMLKLQTKTNEYGQELLRLSEGRGGETCYRKEKQ